MLYSRMYIHKDLSQFQFQFLYIFIHKTTILYTSHYLEQAEAFCDRIAIVENGNILRIGNPKDLIKQDSQISLEDLFLKLTGRKIVD